MAKCTVKCLLIYTVSILQLVTCIPPPYESELTDGECVGCISHYENTANQHRVKRAASGFKYRYVTQCEILREDPVSGRSIEVAATLEVSNEALEKAARLAFLMLRFMPRSMFIKLTKEGRIGVFAPDQVVGDFPEYANTKSSEACKDRCDGNCRSTCTPDGRKFDNLSGYSKSRAVVREDNLLCGKTDAWGGRLNVLIHEFAHIIHLYVLGLDYKRSVKLDESFTKSSNVWGSGYATSNPREYFAEATSSYFRTSLLMQASAEMNFCGNPKNRTLCPDEHSSRENLKLKDELLFSLVDDIYSDQRQFLEGRVGVCDW